MATHNDLEYKEDSSIELSVLREKFVTSLDQLDSTMKTIHSINKELGELEKKDLKTFLRNVINSKDERVIVIPREEHEIFKERLKKLCSMRQTLNKYHSTVEALSSCDFNLVEKLIKEKMDHDKAEYQRQVAECEKIEKEAFGNIYSVPEF